MLNIQRRKGAPGSGDSQRQISFSPSPPLLETLKIPGAGRAYGIPSTLSSCHVGSLASARRWRASNCATALEFHERLTGRSAIYADRCETMTWPRRQMTFPGESRAGRTRGGGRGGRPSVYRSSVSIRSESRDGSSHSGRRPPSTLDYTRRREMQRAPAIEHPPPLSFPLEVEADLGGSPADHRVARTPRGCLGIPREPLSSCDALESADYESITIRD